MSDLVFDNIAVDDQKLGTFSQVALCLDNKAGEGVRD